MPKQVIRNTFTGGMNTDVPDYMLPNDQYSYALNAIDESREGRMQGLVNEEANELAASFGGKIVGKTHIDERNQTLFFVYNGASELWLFNHSDNSTQFVCSDQEFGCNWGFDKCEYIYGEFKYFNNCYEMHVYWSSACIYHVVNIDEMLDPPRKAAIQANEDCDYFDVFRCICGPKLSAITAENSGTSLEGGSYAFSVQLEDNDGNTTNWFDISHEAKLPSPDNIAGQVGGGSIRLVIDNLDKKYDKVNIAVIRTVAGATVIEKVASRSYSDNGVTFEYYGQRGELLDAAVLTTKAKAFLRGQDLIQHNGRMFYYAIKNERNLNYQQYANQIQTEWVEWEVTAEQMRKYNYPSMMRGEVYALGIVWKFCDGTYSPVFHIPASGAAANQNSAPTNDDQRFDIITSYILNGDETSSGSGTIGSQGGSVSFGNCTVSCGPGVFPQGAEITITDYKGGSGTRLNNRYDMYSNLYDITSSVPQQGPLNVTFSDVDAPDSAKVYYIRGDVGTPLQSSSYNAQSRTMTAELPHLSAFAVAGPASTGNGDTSGNAPSDIPINITGVQSAGSDFVSGGATAPSADSILTASDLQQKQELKRKRNPSKVEDRPNESDKVEEDVMTNLTDWDTLEQSYKDIAECGACTRECWCGSDCCECGMTVTEECSNGVTCTSVYECEPQDDQNCDCDAYPTAVNNDLDNMSKIERNNQEAIALYGRDHDDPDINRNGNLRDSAKDLVDNAVINREYITRERPKLSFSDSSSASSSGTSPQRGGNDPEPKPSSKAEKWQQEGVGECTIRIPDGGNAASLRGDNWVDGFGNNLTDEPPRVTGSGATEPYVSQVEYPDATDCDGNYFYPQGPIRHHRIPWADERPHFVSYQNGVVNKMQPDNAEYGNTYIRLMGMRFRNIRIPEPDELPKPLCPNSPYKIVYVKRTDENKSVFAKGWFSGIFEGEVYGKQYAYPRHGVNSFEHVDRFIAAGGDGTSRLGSQSQAPMYTFHSPDTDCDQSFLPVSHVRPELSLRGSGWRHGLYAEGKRPPQDQWSGTQIDQKGARVSNNLNHYSQSGGGLIRVSGLTYAPGDTVVTPPDGIDLPLMNRYREKSVFLQTAGNLPGDQVDESFVGDVLTHYAPTSCTAPYGALVRDLKDQYGGVDGLSYVELGLNAHAGHYGKDGIEGICGDVYIGFYSKRRTSYVSNKVGNRFDVEIKPGSPCRPRSVCDSPDDKIFQYMGIDHYPSRLPESGDEWDARNYAGLHTIGGGSCGHLSKDPGAAAAAGTSESDWYYPRTLKSLVHCWVESHVNPWLMETGEGSQLQNGMVYYPKLKDLYIDSDIMGHPWEESFLNRFYCKVEQPSIKQRVKKAMIRTLLNLVLPAFGLTNLQDLETVMDGTTLFLIFPMLAAMWILGNNTLFTDRRLDKLLGIGSCRTDEEGGDLDECIENWEDAYCKYNWDYSKVNDTQIFYAFPNNYNTCDCDSCLAWDTEILMENNNKKIIRDIEVGDVVVSYDFDKEEYVNKKVTTKWDRGEKTVYRIHFRGGGYADATSDHKWFVTDNWNGGVVKEVTTQEIIDSRLELERKIEETGKRRPHKYSICYAYNIPSGDDTFLTEKEAYVLGMYIAEGSRPHKNDNWKSTFFISQLNEQGCNKLEKILTDTNFKWKKHSKGYYLSDVGDHEQLFLEVGNGALNKKIPTKLFSLRKNILEKLYEGLVHGDGTRIPEKIDKNGYNIASCDYYYTASEELANDVRLLSNIIGKPSCLNCGIRSGFGSNNLQYTIRSSEKSWFKNKKIHIKEIEELGEKIHTYDIEIEDTKAFILAKTGAISHNCDKSNVNNEIYHSNKQIQGSEIDAYRNVKINNYKEIPSHAGKIRRLFKQSNRFYAHTTDGLWLLRTAEEGFPSDTGTILAGTGQLMADPVLLFDGVREGYAGTEDPNAGINTSMGYFFVDRTARKIYQFLDGTPREISSSGMFNFFKNNIEYCQAKGCVDEKDSRDTHFSLGWDPRHNRLLVTKKDAQECNSWTLSYTPIGPDGRGRWLSFHSYQPVDYLWDRANMYTITENEVWIHHKPGKYTTYYDDEFPYIVQFAAVGQGGKAWSWEKMELKTYAEQAKGGYFIRDIDKTFNKTAVWNSTQGTGEVETLIISDDWGKDNDPIGKIKHNPSKIRFHKEHREWRVNEYKDLIKDGCSQEPLLKTECDCQPIPDLNDGIFDCSVLSKRDFKNRILNDSFLNYRFILDDDHSTRLHIIYNDSYDDAKNSTKE